MENEKENVKKNKNNWILNTIIISTIIILIVFFQFFYKGDIDNKEKINGQRTVNITKLPTYVIEGEVSIDTSVSGLNLTEGDKKFIDQLYLTWTPVGDDLECIIKASKRKNLTDTQRCAKFLKQDTEISLSQIDKYNISSVVEITFEEYKKSLQYYHEGGKNLEMGIETQNIGLMANATKQIAEGNNRIRFVMVSLNAIFE